MADVKLRLEIDPTAQTESDRYYEIDKFNGLKSVSSTSQSVTDGSSIQYGILPNTGSAKVVDVNGKLADLIKSGNLADHDVNCDLYLNGNKIQHHLTSDSDYYEDKILTMNFKDSLSQLSERTFSGMPLTEPTTAFGVLSYIFYKMGYVLENVGTWTKFRHSSFIAYDELTNTMTSSRGPIVGFPLFITKGEQHTLTIKCTTPTYTPYDTYSGIAVQILENYPDDSSISSAIVTEYFDATDSNMQEKILTFTPTTDKVYFAMDFAYIDNGQTVTTTLNDITLDGNNLASLLQNEIVLNNGEIGTVRQHLDSIKIKYPYLEESSFSEAINKVCDIAQLNCIEDEDGNIKFVSARPLVAEQNKSIHIPRHAQETFPRDSLFVKNKIAEIKKEYKITQSKSNSEAYKTVINFNKIYENGTPTTNPDETSSIPLSTYDSSLPDYHIVKTGYKSLTDQTDRWEMLSITVDKINILNFEKAILEASQISYSGGIEGFEDLTIASERCKVVSSYDDFLDKFFTYDIRENKYYLQTNNVTLFNELLLSNGSGVYGIMPDEYNNKIKIFAFVKMGTWIYENSSWVPHFATDFTIALYQTGIEQSQSATDSKKYDYELPTNELMQDNTTCNSTPIVTTLTNNILSDYKFGIKSTEVRIKLMDFKNGSDSYSLDYESGEILNVGDCVIIDSDNFGTSAFTYPDGTDVLWKVTGRQFEYSGVPIMVLQLQQIRNLFAQLSWSDISTIASSGKAGGYFSVDDKKEITLTDGSSATLKIMRINTDTLSDDSTAGLTIMLDTLLPEERAMHSGTATPWSTCNMRTWLNSNSGGRAYFPSEVLEVIKERKNSQPGYSGSSLITDTCNDYLWIPVETELEKITNGNQTTAQPDRAKTSENGQITSYWLRNQTTMITRNLFKYVKADGSIPIIGASNSSLRGIRVGFCVGKVDSNT